MINGSISTNEDCYSDGTRVIYRQREDWSRQQGYSTCTFLDAQDTVLACDRSGCIDVVRLPPYGQSPRTLGTVLIDGLDLGLGDQTRSLTPKLKSLKGGQAFVVACAGSYHIVASERVKSWGQDRQLKSSHFSVRSPSPFVSALWTFHGPRRKYYRDFQNIHLSLTGMATLDSRPSQVYDYTHLLQEIQGWDIGKPIERQLLEESQIGRRRAAFQSAKWDFLQTGSSLQTARVDSEHDAFWLQLIDERLHQPVVCVDITSKDATLFCEEHITACAFASRNVFATAHLTCASRSTMTTPLTSKSSQQRQERMNSFVKLWDMRMISTIRQDNSLSTIHFAPFPSDLTVPVAPYLSIENQWSGKESNQFIILALSASSNEDRGTLLLTAQSHTDAVVDHFILNLGHLGCQRIHRQKDDQESLLFDVSAGHDTFACVENTDDIVLWDLHDECLSSHRSKRKIDGSLKDEESHSKPSASIPINVKDRHGLETQLSCIAMNPTGTSIVGGSLDGDIIVWRGF